MKRILHHYFGQITEKICGYEFTTSFVFKSDSLDEDKDHIEKTFRENADDIQQEDITIFDISKEDYDNMGCFLADLTVKYE